jgi:hypothetical protein
LALGFWRSERHEKCKGRKGRAMQDKKKSRQDKVKTKTKITTQHQGDYQQSGMQECDQIKCAIILPVTGSNTGR